MLLLGIDLGTSAVKVAIIDAASGKLLASVRYPDNEREIKSLQPGWAEQSPLQWWEDVKNAIRKANASGSYQPADIAAIGIAYQMHGLVLTGKDGAVLRDSIIWCDSRAVATGNKLFQVIGREKCLNTLLNAPGNFTAAKLAWVKAMEPAIYEQINKLMLPGDFIAMKMTGDLTTSIAALSEGIFWDFENQRLSEELFAATGFDPAFVPSIRDVFSAHGHLSAAIATELSLTAGIPISYKAGDQPNNALSLNVLEPGEVAANAGTSGVIYAVSDQVKPDPHSRVNSFAHVNHASGKNRLGVLLNINGTGILNSWIRRTAGTSLSYAQMNEEAGGVPPGSEGLIILPFGNGAERMLNNRTVHGHIHHIDFNRHERAHLFRAAQEGIAFAFRYGLDILRENGIHPRVIRAGRANMFLSNIFTTAFVNTSGIPVEFYQTEGSVGAAIGAGLGAGIYKSTAEAFRHLQSDGKVEPGNKDLYEDLYQQWKTNLIKHLND